MENFNVYVETYSEIGHKILIKVIDVFVCVYFKNFNVHLVFSWELLDIAYEAG